MWVDALRSGKYKRGKNALRKIDEKGEEKFCCLGVLCDVAIQNGVEILVQKSTWHPENFAYGKDQVDDFLPEEVIQWAGLDTEDPETGRTSLASKNDKDWSFKRIADSIEKHL
jgi:hypothetical protein